MKLYCPKCQDVYTPKSSRHHHTDGAYFGTGFPHMLFMVHAEYRPKRPPNQFIPRYDPTFTTTLVVSFVVFFSESGKSLASMPSSISCSYSSLFTSSVSIPLCLSRATFLIHKICIILTFLCTISSLYFSCELSVFDHYLYVCYVGVYIYIIYIYVCIYVIKISFQYGIIIFIIVYV